MVQAAAFAYRHAKQAKDACFASGNQAGGATSSCGCDSNQELLTPPKPLCGPRSAECTEPSGLFRTSRRFEASLIYSSRENPNASWKSELQTVARSSFSAGWPIRKLKSSAWIFPGGWFGGGYPSMEGCALSTLRQPGSEAAPDSRRFPQQGNIFPRKGHARRRKIRFHFYRRRPHLRRSRARLRASTELAFALDGIIGLHDIVPNATDPDCQVPRFWKDLLKTKRRLPIDVESQSQPGAGIGIILPSV